MLLCHRCPHHVPEICNPPAAAAPSGRCCDDAASPADAGDFVALFERHHHHVVAWACRLTRNYDLATDLAQEVFIKAWTGMAGFRHDARFTTWLFQITRNCCFDYLKARAARPREVNERALLWEHPVVANEAIATLEAEHAAALVRDLIRDAKLDAVEVRAVVLHYGGGMPLSAVTKRLGLKNPSGARAPIVSAKRKLRKSVRLRRRSAAPRVPAASTYAGSSFGR